MAGHYAVLAVLLLINMFLAYCTLAFMFVPLNTNVVSSSLFDFACADPDGVGCLNPHGKSHVALGILRNTNTDTPSRSLFREVRRTYTDD